MRSQFENILSSPTPNPLFYYNCSLSLRTVFTSFVFVWNCAHVQTV